MILRILVVTLITLVASWKVNAQEAIRIVDNYAQLNKQVLAPVMDDQIYVINFWATWCAPCKKELNTIHEVYEDWVAETGVTLIAVAIDDEKTKSQVPVYVNGKAWDYVVLMDPNWDFKRAMGVNNVPHTFLVDKDGNIVYSHNNYAPGDEEKLYQELLKLSGK